MGFTRTLFPLPLLVSKCIAVVFFFSAKRPLVSEEDMLKLKEEELRKAALRKDPQLLTPDGDDVNGSTFDEFTGSR